MHGTLIQLLARKGTNEITELLLVGIVYLALLVTHVAVQHQRHLLGQVGGHILFSAPKDERLDFLLQLLSPFFVFKLIDRLAVYIPEITLVAQQARASKR